MKNKKIKKDVVIYQAKNGAIELRGDILHDTIWATQAQIADVFGVNVRTVSEHLVNIFKTKELNKDSVIRNFRNTATDGKTYNVQFYNLDAIISVGYRVNSKTATLFRQWATKTLREYITKGYTINRKQITKNYETFMKSVGDIQALLPEHIILDPKSILELIKEFSSTWMSLDAYDKETLKPVGKTKKSIKLSGEELMNEIKILRIELLKKGETPLQAVIRETKEEDLKYLCTSEIDWDGQKIVRYIFLYPTEQVKFNVKEGRGGLCLNFEEVRKLLNDKDYFDEFIAKIKQVIKNNYEYNNSYSFFKRSSTTSIN